MLTCAVAAQLGFMRATVLAIERGGQWRACLRCTAASTRMKATIVNTTKMATISLPPFRFDPGRAIPVRGWSSFTKGLIEGASLAVVFKVTQLVVHDSRLHPDAFIETLGMCRLRYRIVRCQGNHCLAPFTSRSFLRQPDCLKVTAVDVEAGSLQVFAVSEVAGNQASRTVRAFQGRVPRFSTVMIDDERIWKGNPAMTPTCEVVNFSPTVVAIVVTPWSDDGPWIAQGLREQGRP